MRGKWSKTTFQRVFENKLYLVMAVLRERESGEVGNNLGGAKGISIDIFDIKVNYSAWVVIWLKGIDGGWRCP